MRSRRADVEDRLTEWIEKNFDHDKYDAVVGFQWTGFDRFAGDLKAIRNLLVGVILNSPKSWEVLVGKAIANLSLTDKPDEHSLQSYLGSKVIRHLFLEADTGAP